MKKVRRSEFDITEFSTAKAAQPKVEPAVSMLDRDGSPTGDEGMAAAKAVRGKHYVRFVTDGPEAATPYDPAAEPLASFKRENRQQGRPYYEFQQVSAECYEQYTRYLKGRNRANYRAAAQLST